MVDIVFEASGKLENFIQELNKISTSSKSVIILSCDSNGYTKDDVDASLKKSNASLIGGIFPSIIYENKKYDQGTVFIGLDDLMQVNSLLDISQKDAKELDYEVEEQTSQFDSSVKTMFTFVDGLTTNIGTSIDVLFDNFGLDINYIGGGSGSLSFEQKPSIFSNQGLLKDAFIYAYSTRESSIGVNHGWESISGPYEVTKSEATVIKELDHKPAFEVYKKVVDSVSGEAILDTNFFDIAKSFPFGVNTMTEEKIVRDPIVLHGTDLVCVGNVEEGSYVDILQGKSENLINAAKNASELSKDEMKFEQSFTIFIDCISRVLFLENEFNNEVLAVHEEGIPLVGALSFGEIANNGRNYLEFYNKTAVIGRIGNAL